MNLIELRKANARGYPTGESNGRCVYADAVVAEARRLQAAGCTFKQIGNAIGCAPSTAHYWIHSGRRPHARVVVQRRKPSADQQSVADPRAATSCGDLRSGVRDFSDLA